MFSLSLSSCAHVNSSPNQTFRIIRVDRTQALITIHYPAEKEHDAAIISNLIREALHDVNRWGTLQMLLTITLHGNHKELEKAVGVRDYGWLRAWATYDTIDIQTPGTWGGGRLEERIKKVLTHELTHTIMYQAIGTKDTWASIYIPIWFREGMASTTARQGNWRFSRNELNQRFLSNAPSINLFSNPKTLLQTEARLIYSASHWLFTDLIARYGEDSVRNLLKEIRNRKDFRQAWNAIFKLSEEHYLSLWQKELIIPRG